MPKAREILSATAVSRALARIASEIVEKNGGLEGVALVGIRTRGVPLAERLAKELQRLEGAEVPVGSLDITLYRDDILAAGAAPVIRATHIPFDVQDLSIVLVDDVLHTGRTVRAALDALMAHGRPRRIQLAVLVDRGGRELPISADYVGRAVETQRSEQVKVELKESDSADRVTLEQAEAK